MGDAPEQKQSWWKKKWVWGVAGAIILIGVVGNMLGLGNDRDDPAAPAPTVTVETSASGPTTAEESAPMPTEEAAQAGPTEEERAAAFDQSIRDAFGGASYAELAAQDGLTWPGYVNAIRVERSNAFVTLQIASNDPSRDELGKRAASALSTLLPASAFDGISWIVVEDASGVVIAQEQPSPLA
jgi:hypothetical protein